MKGPKEGDITVGLPGLSTCDTVEMRRPVVDTVELPPIPKKPRTEDVTAQVAAVLSELEECPFEFDEEEELDEMQIRSMLVNQLEKVTVFLDKILALYRDGVPTLPEQINVYRSTIDMNVKALRNPQIDIKNIIVNLKRIMLGFIKNLQLQFGHEEDDDFRFEAVIKEIERCLSLLKSKL